MRLEPAVAPHPDPPLGGDWKTITRPRNGSVCSAESAGFVKSNDAHTQALPELSNEVLESRGAVSDDTPAQVENDPPVITPNTTRG